MKDSAARLSMAPLNKSWPSENKSQPSPPHGGLIFGACLKISF